MKKMWLGLLLMGGLGINVYVMGKTMLRLTSSSFKDGAEIPSTFTCKGDNISPALRWQVISPAMQEDGIRSALIMSYVLIMDDPDAQRVVGKTFVHWIVLLARSITQLPEGVSGKQRSSVPGIELLNDFRTVQYGGPCPPKGTGIHTYRFTLFALSLSSEQLQADPRFPKAPFTAEQFADAFEKNIVAKGRITGTYVVNSNK